MSKITLNRSLPGFDITSTSVLEEFFDYDIHSYSSTQLTLAYGSERFQIIGTGFQMRPSGGEIIEVTAGTVRQLKLTEGSITWFDWTGLSAAATSFYNFVETFAWDAMDKLLLSGNDQITLTNGNDNAKGFDGNDLILGLNGHDTLDGGRGNDTLDGGNGNDWLYGDAGHDLLRGGTGNDMLNGGTGNDTLLGGGGADTLFGGTGNDSLDGGVGADQLDGGSGNDVLIGGGGSDRLFGGAGQDTLDGGVAADRLDGGAGNDRLIGGAGVDILTGGAGRDTFVFTSKLAKDYDRITDFQSKFDKIELDADIFTEISYSGALRAGDFVYGVTAQDAADRLIYQESTGKLWYDADGSGAGAKVLVANLGANTDLVAADILIL